MSITESITEQILSSLSAIESERKVRIPIAVESGSRAWGFASQDSDYDVRFIYIRPVEDYLRIRPMRDVIELPLTEVLDINGWDLVKALNLFRASNPPLLEWLRSPIVYRESGELASDLRELSQTHFSPRRMTYHYLSMAKRNWLDHVDGKDEIRPKKLLYALRPLFCIRWLEQRNSPPPTSIHTQIEGIELSKAVLDDIAELIALKKTGLEGDAKAVSPVLIRFCSDELERLNEVPRDLPDPEISEDILNALFRKHLYA